MASLGGALIVSLFILWMLSLVYLPLWQLFQEGHASPKNIDLTKPGKPIVFPRYFKTPLGAMFEKEGLIFFREMKSALWFFFILALWAVQIILEFFIRSSLLQHGENLSAVVAQIEARSNLLRQSIL